MPEPVGGPRYGVLVVEDDAAIRNILSLSLPRLGLNVWVAGDGPAALALYEQNRDEIDLALIDLRLPGMDGLTVAAALRQLDATLPCCLMSGDPGEVSSDAVCCVLPKPFSPLEAAARCAACVQAKGA